MSEGKVRLLPPDTPGLPPSVPYEAPNGYQNGEHQVCGAWVQPPLDVRLTLGTERTHSFYCTRPNHSDEEIHVCHYRKTPTYNPDAPVHTLIVWGGE